MNQGDPPAPEYEQARAKAGRLLAEAEAMDTAATPSAIVHACYYAMYQAARAVLLRIDGDRAPTRHGVVIGRFGQIALKAGTDRERLTQAGRDLNRMYDERVAADYDVAEITDTGTAIDALAKARDFVSVCDSVLSRPLDKSAYR